MGGPDSLEAVEPFLYNLFSDRELIRLPLGAVLQRPFARLISHFRAKRVRENYRIIGGRSRCSTGPGARRQGSPGNSDRLSAPPSPCATGSPGPGRWCGSMAAEGVERAVVLSMYPHYTGATTGSSMKDFRRAVAALHPRLNYTVIEQWYDWPGYLDALAARVQEGMRVPSGGSRPVRRSCFPPTALPQKFIDRGDPYLEHVLDTVRGVMQRVGKVPWHLGFQSRSGPVRWMEPGTVEVLDRLAADGCRAVLMVPVSFVSDHIETLHEIDIEYRAHAAQRGIRHFARSPSLNDGPDFLQAMADLVRSHLQKPL